MIQASSMIRTVLALLANLAIVGSTGCQMAGDPRDDGFLAGVSGLGSGSYQQMVRDRRSKLTEEELIRQELEATYAEKKSESDQAAIQLSRTRAELEGLTSEPSSLEGNANSAAEEAKPTNLQTQ